MLKLSQSSEDIPESRLDLWSDRAEMLGPEVIGAALNSGTREVVNGRAHYDHASDFLHAMLRDLEQKRH
ncbi:hypothetical protein XH88_27595 [Bradyrhizobium sp. CCBAU 51627]|nr:hypothetical protein [Bradyrhizobium sp. CCBAU 51627]